MAHARSALLSPRAHITTVCTLVAPGGSGSSPDLSYYACVRHQELAIALTQLALNIALHVALADRLALVVLLFAAGERDLELRTSRD